MSLLRLLADTIPQAGSAGAAVPGGGAKTAWEAAIDSKVSTPLFLGLQLLIPAYVLIAALHKLMDHKESGGAFIIEVLVRGVGAVAIVQMVKALFT